MTKLGVSNARTHLVGLFPEGIPLQSAFVAPSLIEQLNAAVEEALDSKSWMDCLPLVPSVLSAADAADLLARCPCVKTLGESHIQPLCNMKVLGWGFPARVGSRRISYGCLRVLLLILGACVRSKGADKGQLLAESCVVSSEFLDGLRERALAEARSVAEEALKQRTASSASATTSAPQGGAHAINLDTFCSFVSESC